MTQAPHDAAPRYRLETLIATGGMGEVWRATDTVLDRVVALKVLKHEYAGDPTFRSRFEAEARHAASLYHPGVAAVFDFGELPPDPESGGVPRPYLVMELVPGRPLSELLRGEPMDPEVAADLVAQAAEAVAAAHAIGIVHRDLKPGNLLVTPDGRVKITDFGIARALGGASVTRTGQVLGTPAYLSPEQAEGRPATEASDVYCLGVVLYECLAGRRPFERDTPVGTAIAHLRDDPPPLPDTVPRHLRDATMTALAKDPADRFASMADFAAALRGTGPATVTGQAAAPAAAADEGPTATRVLTVPGPGPAAAPAAPGPAREPRRRTPAWLPWALAAAAVLAVVLLVSLLGRPDDPDRSGSNSGPGAGEETASTEPKPSPSPEQTPTQEQTTDTQEPAPETVEVNADDYRGLDKKTAHDQLKALGLKVREETVDNDGSVEKDTVLDVTPVGTLQKGDEVTIVVAGPPPREDEPPGHSKGKGPKKPKKDED